MKMKKSLSFWIEKKDTDIIHIFMRLPIHVAAACWLLSIFFYFFFSYMPNINSNRRREFIHIEYINGVAHEICSVVSRLEINRKCINQCQDFCTVISYIHTHSICLSRVLQILYSCVRKLHDILAQVMKFCQRIIFVH